MWRPTIAFALVASVGSLSLSLVPEQSAPQANGAADAAQAVKPVRSESSVGQLLDKLEIQNAGADRFNDSWLQTLKDIVDLGPQAVPELIAELDATSDNMMLRCCGFTLRAIGEKRAVPALIRAIPKTLLKPGSDMGLNATDPDLAKWAQSHDLDQGPRMREQMYGFGRPVREICGALNKLTGQKMGEEELYHMFLSGLETQREVKRELFYRQARRWADWWEEHAAEFTADTDYHRVNLPPLVASVAGLPNTGAHYKTEGGSSNWILESIFSPKAARTFYDLDSGRVSGLPEQWRNAQDKNAALDDILTWAVREGFDLMGTEYTAADGQRYYALLGVALAAWELDAGRWKMRADDTTIDALQAEGTLTQGLLLHRDKTTQQVDPKATASFLYITSQGTPGLLFVGIEVNDDSLTPGGVSMGDHELNPVHFVKGRRFAFTEFVEVKSATNAE